MTTITRKWNYASIVLETILILAGVPALADDDADQTLPQQVQTHVKGHQPQAFDQQYRLPPSYQGKYYPNDDTSAIGYHGTSRTSENDPSQNETGKSANGSYYYYYY